MPQTAQALIGASEANSAESFAARSHLAAATFTDQSFPSKKKKTP
jgi:hypothetical protein